MRTIASAIETVAGALKSSASLQWVAVAVVVASAIFGLFPEVDRIDIRGTASDFTQDYVSARALQHGDDPYAGMEELVHMEVGPGEHWFLDAPSNQRNPHTPAEILVFAPIAWLSFHVARITWLWVSAFCLIASLVVVCRTLRWRLGPTIFVSATAFLLPVVRSELEFGQINSVLVLLLVLTWWCLLRGNNVGAGLALGVCAAIKLFPIFLLIPLVRRRHWNAVWSAMGSMIVLTLASSAVVGMHAVRTFVRVASPDSFNYWAGQPDHISIAGHAFRWLTSNVWYPGGPHLLWLAWTLTAAGTAVVIVAAYFAPDRVTGEFFWISVPCMILASPLAWSHYLMMTLPLILLVIARGTWRYVPVLLAAYVMVSGRAMSWFPSLFGLAPLGVGYQLLSGGIVTCALIAIVLAGWSRKVGTNASRSLDLAHV